MTEQSYLREPEKAVKEVNVAEKDSFGVYLQEIGRTPLLDSGQEVELAKTIEAGLMAQHLIDLYEQGQELPAGIELEELEWLSEEGKRAKEHFIQANLRLVVSLARRYVRSPLPMIDKVQEGNTGVIHAVEKFDYTKGYKFSTYATWWIRQAITRGITNTERVVRLPVHIVEDINKVRKVKEQLLRASGQEPTVEEIAAEAEFEVDYVRQLIEWGREHRSLDEPIKEGSDTSLGEFIGDMAEGSDFETDVEDSQVWEVFTAQLKRVLTDREYSILYRRNGIGTDRQETFKSIGKSFGLSAERVRQIEKEAVIKARKLLTQPAKTRQSKNTNKTTLHSQPTPEPLSTDFSLRRVKTLFSRINTYANEEYFTDDFEQHCDKIVDEVMGAVSLFAVSLAAKTEEQRARRVEEVWACLRDDQKALDRLQISLRRYQDEKLKTAATVIATALRHMK